MMIVDFLLFITFLISSHSEVHYAVHSSLPVQHIHRLVKREGGIVRGSIPETNVYHVVLPQHAGRTTPVPSSSSGNPWIDSYEDEHSVRLHEHPEVRLVHQPALRISKRAGEFYQNRPDFDVAAAKTHGKIKKPEAIQLPSDAAYEEQFKNFAEVLKRLVKFSDVGAAYAWQYLNDGTRGSELIGYDLNVYPVYALGISGKGVNALILDDALDTEHFDLKDNFNPDISINLNDGEVSLRGPNRFMGEDDRHGTQCAGLLAAVANNDYCSHGVAYKAQIGIVRMLAGLVTDILEATSMVHMSEVVDIYVASWGPKDDGQTMDKPRIHASAALQRSNQKGRRGNGSLFIFASGNGGHLGDHCGADGFIGSPSVIAVTALDNQGIKAIYSESCASIRFAVPVGSPQISLQQEADILPSTSGNNECMLSFVGTSAAAPLAAGCIALLLEIRPELSARDVENILPWSARIPNPTDTEWLVNGAGVLYNPHTGYGLLDCARLVDLGSSWAKLEPPCVASEKVGTAMHESWGRYQDAIPGDKNYRHLKHLNDVHEFQSELRGLVNNGSAGKLLVKRNNSAQFTLMVKAANDISKSSQIEFSCLVEVVEKVVITVQWKHICRGSMSIWLKSPSGTRVSLLNVRPNDTYAGEGNMQFTSVAHWGELIDGDWVVGVDNDASCENHIINGNQRDDLMGVVVFTELIFVGTSKKDSAFKINEELITSLRTTVSHKAAEEGLGHTLSAEEVKSTFDQQRWLTLNRSIELVKAKHPYEFAKSSKPKEGSGVQTASALLNSTGSVNTSIPAVVNGAPPNVSVGSSSGSSIPNGPQASLLPTQTVTVAAAAGG